jgi:undecaprenyl-diphosphatase
MEYLAAFLMGVVEGLTEYVPVSSTGHLILAGHLLGFERMLGKEVADTFAIFVQLGAILAVVAAYPGRFAGLLRLRDNRGFHGLRGIGLLAVTSIPGALVGLAAHKLIKERLFSPLTVAIGLALGAVWIALVEQWLSSNKKLGRPAKKEGLDSLSWLDALGIGLFQCLALWPGMSRSSSTILGGMMLGVERKTATEYSFFAAVPLLAAATLYDLYKSLPILSASHVPVFAIGLATSFVFAWLAVKFFIRFLAHHTLAPFGWYRLAVAAIVLAWAIW